MNGICESFVLKISPVLDVQHVVPHPAVEQLVEQSGPQASSNMVSVLLVQPRPVSLEIDKRSELPGITDENHLLRPVGQRAQQGMLFGLRGLVHEDKPVASVGEVGVARPGARREDNVRLFQDFLHLNQTENASSLRYRQITYISPAPSSSSAVRLP